MDGPSAVAFYAQMLGSPGYIDALVAKGIPRERWQLLTSPRLLSQSELRSAYETVNDVIHCTESQTGNALVAVPVELVASVIYSFAKPVNWHGLASVCGSLGVRSMEQMSAMATQGQATGESEHMTYRPPTVDQIMVWLMKLAQSTLLGQDFTKAVKNALTSVGVRDVRDNPPPPSG